MLSPIVFFTSFTVLDGLAKSVAGDAGPAWLADEVGIVTTGAAWLAASLWSLRAAVLEGLEGAVRS